MLQFLERWWRAGGRGAMPAADDNAARGVTRKDVSGGPYVAFHSPGQPVWTPRDYGTFAREGYMQNAIVYRSVRMVAEAAASIPLLVYYEGAHDRDVHPLAELLRRLNEEQTSVDLLDAAYASLMVSGNAYVEALGINGAVRELHVLRADRVQVVAGQDGWPDGYDYQAGGVTMRKAGDVIDGVPRVLHVRLYHPVNDHYGLSPIEAAASSIDIHNAASGWNKALLDNAARPSGALVYGISGGSLTDEQFDRLKAELEQNYQGARNAGRPMLLAGGLDWKPLAMTPKDMDFIEAKHAAARDIALAIGVPPMLLGIPGDNTYSNYQEATRFLWRQTVLPLVNKLAASLSAWLAPTFGGDVRLKPDLDAVGALNGEREALWSRLQNVSFLTDDEKRAAIGSGPRGSD